MGGSSPGLLPQVPVDPLLDPLGIIGLVRVPGVVDQSNNLRLGSHDAIGGGDEGASATALERTRRASLVRRDEREVEGEEALTKESTYL